MRDKILNYQQLECDYFNLYNQFISVDFQISLFEKNHKSLIKDFIFFYHQILKEENKNYQFKSLKELESTALSILSLKALRLIKL
ncbi:hypothetical protein OS383_000409 [Campylobacter coli]|nr:hypothetical protein [Campylobacter coli]EAL5693037.1 hypothetical protein [Campylobacter coli]EEO7793978.1 hypothetical protein [Campylobacter coli]EGA2822677.1 hypothetical protein [Campylobacter coli]EIC6876489.1 hypothetical protein [Campylobacter coli]